MPRFLKFTLLFVASVFALAVPFVVGEWATTLYLSPHLPLSLWDKVGALIVMGACAIYMAIPLQFVVGATKFGDLRCSTVAWFAYLATLLASVLAGVASTFTTVGFWPTVLGALSAILSAWALGYVGHFLWRHLIVLDTPSWVNAALRNIRRATFDDGESEYGTQAFFVEAIAYEAFCKLFGFSTEKDGDYVQLCATKGDYLRLRNVTDADGNDYSGDYVVTWAPKSVDERLKPLTMAPEYLRQADGWATPLAL